MAESLGQKIARWLREGVPIGEILRRRRDHMRASYNARVAERKKKEADRLAKMTPPARCWRIGREVFWEHPDSPIPVNFFEISEQMSDGRWTVHGTKTPADKHEAVLYGDGACRVEACYPADWIISVSGARSDTRSRPRGLYLSRRTNPLLCEPGNPARERGDCGPLETRARGTRSYRRRSGMGRGVRRSVPSNRR